MDGFFIVALINVLFKKNVCLPQPTITLLIYYLFPGLRDKAHTYTHTESKHSVKLVLPSEKHFPTFQLFQLCQQGGKPAIFTFNTSLNLCDTNFVFIFILLHFHYFIFKTAIKIINSNNQEGSGRFVVCYTHGLQKSN